MKIITMLIKSVLSVAFIFLLSFLATFFLAIFMPENVQKALEIFMNLIKIP
jgi:hypothetical protein